MLAVPNREPKGEMQDKTLWVLQALPCDRELLPGWWPARRPVASCCATQNSGLHDSPGLLTGPWLVSQDSAGVPCLLPAAEAGLLRAPEFGLQAPAASPSVWPSSRGFSLLVLCQPLEGPPSLWSLQHHCWPSSCGCPGPQENKGRSCQVQSKSLGQPRIKEQGALCLGGKSCGAP